MGSNHAIIYSMKEFICYICTKNFNRYPSQVRNKDQPTCSKKCYTIRQKEISLGTSNPNYRHGNHVESKCSCGQDKDYRAILCSRCSGRSHSIKYLNEDSDDEILKAIETSYSYLETSSKLKMSRYNVTKYIRDNDIDISHFKSTTYRPITDEKLFIKSDKKRYKTVKDRILELKLLEYKCSNPKCNIHSTWNEEPLVLDLDHTNGNSYDNRLENLRFLCPNCHSQTKTYKGKRRKVRNQS